MRMSLVTSLTLHGVTIRDFAVDVEYRFRPLDVPFGPPDRAIIDRITFPYMDGVDIDLTPIYDRQPKLLEALRARVESQLKLLEQP